MQNDKHSQLRKWCFMHYLLPASWKVLSIFQCVIYEFKYFMNNKILMWSWSLFYDTKCVQLLKQIHIGSQGVSIFLQYYTWRFVLTKLGILGLTKVLQFYLYPICEASLWLFLHNFTISTNQTMNSYVHCLTLLH